MEIAELASLNFWNGLVREHLSEVVMVLTAALVALADRYARRLLQGWTSSWNRALRLLTFLLVCSAGYAALALGLAWAVRSGLTLSGGAYMAPVVLGVLLLVALEAQRQRQI
ncbi:MAG: DUF3392 family protein [Polyangia bacterium]